jgi:hypothetical protein
MQSISTFCVLGRHALILSGQAPQFQKLEVVGGLETALNCKLHSFRAILTAREAGKLSAEQNAKNLLEGYLSEIDTLVRFVDGIGQ